MKYSWLGEQTTYRLDKNRLKWKQKMGFTISFKVYDSILLEWKLKSSKPHNDHRVFKF